MESSIRLFQVRNTPPYERPNWERLNEGQRRYAYEQWMLSKVYAGHELTHPLISDTQSNTNSETSTSGATSTSNNLSQNNNISDGQLGSHHSRSDTEDNNSSISVGEMSAAQHDPMVVDPTGSNKRPNEDAGPSNTKQARTNGPGGKKAIGTAKPQGMEGSGERPIIYIDRPMNSKTIVIKTFKKQHKFLTFGIASTIITNNIPASTDPAIAAHKIYYCTTALAEVPVHIPALYLNPSEFALLPPGAEVLEVNVTVVQRNPLLSFFTNASSTQLATLNQNKNGVYAIGLNKTGYGTDRWYYEFNTTEPMIPTKVYTPAYKAVTTPITYQGLSNDLYGFDNTDASFDTVVPKHQLGMYTVLKNYFCLTTTDKYTGGWPNLQSKITEYDASAMTGELICTYNYKPKMGLLKLPQAYLPTQVPLGPNTFTHGNLQSQFETVNINNETYSTATHTYGYDDRTRNYPGFDIYLDIEKSQYLVRGIGGQQQAQIQDSLHIGLNPVPALTTSSLVSGDTNSSFTDTRIYFDVHCEMIVGYRDYTDRPHATSFNCAAGEQILSHKKVNDSLKPINSDSTPYAQLYGEKAIPTV